jgi:hypothetical protein
MEFQPDPAVHNSSSPKANVHFLGGRRNTVFVSEIQQHNKLFQNWHGACVSLFASINGDLKRAQAPEAPAEDTDVARSLPP